MPESKPEIIAGDSKSARGAQKKEEERRAAEELSNKRKMQREFADAAIEQLERTGKELHQRKARLESLESHLNGFYNEIDKLTKGRSMLEVTPLAVEQTNDIIRDAKSIIEDDTYLDRVREFVPAGNNPLYPDVLVTLRIVRESVERFKQTFDKREDGIRAAITRACTISNAIELWLKDGSTTSRDDLEALGIAVANDCLFEAEDGEDYFDFEGLDSRDLKEYLSG